MIMKKAPGRTDPGLPDDPILHKLLTEIDMIAHLTSNEFERLLPEGITSAQFDVINRLLRLDVDETIGELAAAFHVAQPTMSSTVKKLEAKGFVEFITTPADRRIKRVHVTAAGKKIRKEIIIMLEPHRQAFIQTAPDIDWKPVLSALTVLRNYLDQRR